jgi:hypothetical protein
MQKRQRGNDLLETQELQNQHRDQPPERLAQDQDGHGHGDDAGDYDRRRNHENGYCKGDTEAYDRRDVGASPGEPGSFRLCVRCQHVRGLTV